MENNFQEQSAEKIVETIKEKHKNTDFWYGILNDLEVGEKTNKNINTTKVKSNNSSNYEYNGLNDLDNKNNEPQM
ncbi:MAG: hypothetical protein IJZ26_00535 [Clostridia bacterium]|nr:hypothetical protein [Clostridia bacterium]